MTRADGVAGLVRETLAGAAADLGAAQGEQLALIVDAEAILPAGRRIDTDDAAANGARERKAGRPPGSTNLATRELRRALHAVGFDGVWSMARWAMLTPEELAARLQCTRAEAFAHLRALWADLAPYQHSRLAPTDGAGNVAPQMVFAIGGQPVEPGLARPPWEHDRLGVWRDPQGEQNQGLGETDAAPSNAAPSNAEEKP